MSGNADDEQVIWTRVGRIDSGRGATVGSEMVSRDRHAGPPVLEIRIGARLWGGKVVGLDGMIARNVWKRRCCHGSWKVRPRSGGLNHTPLKETRRRREP